jgi:hypothetical protein
LAARVEKLCSRQEKACRVFDQLKPFPEARQNGRPSPNLTFPMNVSGQAPGLIESVSLTDQNPCDDRTGFLKPGKWNPAMTF